VQTLGYCLPEFRNRGIGGRLLRDLQEEAASAGKRVGIHVEKQNPARRLYERLGFAMTQPGDVYDLMEWRG
jgi:ribosomal protein S18 acetylase RimI-like enzyme